MAWSRAQRQLKLQRAVEGAMTYIVHGVNTKRDHIPPVMSSSVTFPFAITFSGPGQVGSDRHDATNSSDQISEQQVERTQRTERAATHSGVVSDKALQVRGRHGWWLSAGRNGVTHLLWAAMPGELSPPAAPLAGGVALTRPGCPTSDPPTLGVHFTGSSSSSSTSTLTSPLLRLPPLLPPPLLPPPLLPPPLLPPLPSRLSLPSQLWLLAVWLWQEASQATPPA
ncbi:MAG: hypothetical protein WDW36_007348 [Sanguina aurantia]